MPKETSGVFCLKPVLHCCLSSNDMPGCFIVFNAEVMSSASCMQPSGVCQWRFAREKLTFVYNCRSLCGCCILGVLTLLGSVTAAVGSLSAAWTLHHGVLLRILRAPMFFFDSTPLGRLINRFSEDTYTIDMTIPQVMRWFMMCFFEVLSTIFIIAFAMPLFLVAVVPLSIIYFFTQVPVLPPPPSLLCCTCFLTLVLRLSSLSLTFRHAAVPIENQV